MYSVYWLLYAFHLYMKVARPQYSMLLDSWHCTKKFYYFEVGLFTAIGTVPYMVLAGLSKFEITHFPPTFCFLNSTGSFYGFILPTIIVNCATMIILLLVLYHVNTVSDNTVIPVLYFSYSTKFWWSKFCGKLSKLNAI